MELERIIISVTHNGYVVENPSNHDYGRLSGHRDTWTFESMKKLQDRLPEILNMPVEKRKAEKP